MLEKWPSKMRKHLTDAKLSKNDVQIEPSLTNNNGEGETAHTENDLSDYGLACNQVSFQHRGIITKNTYTSSARIKCN